MIKQKKQSLKTIVKTLICVRYNNKKTKSHCLYVYATIKDKINGFLKRYETNDFNGSRKKQAKNTKVKAIVFVSNN